MKTNNMQFIKSKQAGPGFIRTLVILLALAAAAFAAGCAESRVNSITTDSPYLNSEKPMLAIKNEHFGGGYTLDNGKRAYFAGGEIFNFGNQPAYSVNIRVRIYGAAGAAYDDHIIRLGDIGPAKSAAFDEKFEAASDYGLSEVTLTYQDDSKINTMVLKPAVKNINNLDKNSY